MDTSYFTASLKHYLPPICFHCGSAEDLLDDTDPYIAGLYELFSVMRPIFCSRKRKQKLGGKSLSRRNLVALQLHNDLDIHVLYCVFHPFPGCDHTEQYSFILIMLMNK